MLGSLPCAGKSCYQALIQLVIAANGAQVEERTGLRNSPDEGRAAEAEVLFQINCARLRDSGRQNFKVFEARTQRKQHCESQRRNHASNASTSSDPHQARANDGWKEAGTEDSGDHQCLQSSRGGSRLRQIRRAKDSGSNKLLSSRQHGEVDAE